MTCVLGESGEIYFPKLKENQLINFKSITEDFFKYLNDWPSIWIEKPDNDYQYQEIREILKQNS